MPFFSSLGATFGRLLIVVSAIVSATITTVIGNGSPGISYDKGLLLNPYGIAVDSTGNLYVADSNYRIRKITPAGITTILAGTGTAGSVNGTGTNASFSINQSLEVDSTGNVYVSSSNHAIRKITTAGVVTTFAGLIGTAGTVNGTGTSARFNFPRGIAFDSLGNMYVAELNRIRKIAPNGVVSLLAGGSSSGAVNGTGSTATFNQPYAVALDSSRNVYVTDQVNNQIRKITPGGLVTTLAGSTTAGNANGTGTNATFNSPRGIAVDSSGNVYVTSSNLIRKITPAGVVSTLAGNAASSGFIDGIGTNARFANPFELKIDSSGNLYVADNANHCIRKITPEGVVTTVVGSDISGNFVITDNSPHVYFKDPYALAIDPVGNLYLADHNNHRIRKITPAGVVTTIAGKIDDNNRNVDGVGTNATLYQPIGIHIDSSGNLFVIADGRVRKITPAGVVSTIAGGGSVLEGVGTNVRFSYPVGAAPDSSGNLYVANYGVTADQSGRVAKISPSGVVSTFKVMEYLFGVATDSVDNIYVTGLNSGAVTKLSPAGVTLSTFSPGGSLAGIMVDSTFNMFVANREGTIRKITPEGVVSTLAGQSLTSGYAEGTGTNVKFNDPRGVAVDSSGNVFVADNGNHRIRKIATDGVVTTFVGKGYGGYSDGGIFDNPSGVAVQSGNVYIADALNNRLLKFNSTGLSTIMYYTGSGTYNNPYGLTFDPTGTLYISYRLGHTIYRLLSNTLTFVAGKTNASGVSSGTGTNASFTNPAGITFNSEGTMFVADSGNHCIRKITAVNNVSFDITGNRTPAFSDGTSQTASFNTPLGVSAAPFGIVYVADTNNHRIRIVRANGNVTTLAGNGTIGSTDGIGTNATFNFPSGIQIDPFGTLFVADRGNHRIRKIETSTGVVSTVAGDGIAGFTTSRFNGPSAITLDNFRNAYVAEIGNHSIRKIENVYTVPENNGVVTTFAGNGTPTFLDGTGTNASFNLPAGVAVDILFNVYVPDFSNRRIRKITPAGVVFTLAGSGTSGSTDGTGAGASFAQPNSIAVDEEMNAYVADRGNNRIRKISPAGVVTTLAGTTVGYLDGTGTNARFDYPSGIAVDSAGNVYVADLNNSRIRKITPTGVVTTIAGSLNGSVDGNGTNANFSGPQGIAIDFAGNIYVGDIYTPRIRKIAPDGVVTTFAGSGSPGSTDGNGTNASFREPTRLAVDSTGNLYVNEAANHRIRKITPDGIVSTVAGSSQGWAEGTGTNAQFNTPAGIAVDSKGILYVSDADNHRIRKVGTLPVQVPLLTNLVINYAINFNRPHGLAIAGSNIYIADTENHQIRRILLTSFNPTSTTFAGSGTAGFADATGIIARFNGPRGVALDGSLNVYVADTNNQRIRKITSGGVVTTLAGSATAGYAEGTGTNARFSYPSGVASDLTGNVYVVELYNHSIRRITPAGLVSTFAGNGTVGYAEGTGTNARFNTPSAITIDSTENLYVADRGNHCIRKITPAGTVSTFAGNGTVGYVDGSGTNVRFSFPTAIGINLLGDLYVGDQNNQRIRKITPAGVVSTVAGGDTGLGYVDGTGTNARFNRPTKIRVDSAGNLYVSDTENNCIRKISSAGVVTTLAGNGNPGYVDGTGTNARFNRPCGIGLDSSFNVYVTDTGNHRIRRITPAGLVTTLAGNGTAGSLNATGTNATFNAPQALGVDATFNVYVADTGNFRIRKISPAGVVTNFAGSGTSTASYTGSGSFISPRGLTIQSTGNIYVIDTVANYNYVLKITPAGEVSEVITTGGSSPFIRRDVDVNSAGIFAVIANSNAVYYGLTSVAGSATAGYAEGTGTNARFNTPQGVTIDSGGNVYVADTENNCIRKITTDGVTSTFAGVGGILFADGTGSNARFFNPSGIAVDNDGSVYVSDTDNARIRKII